MQHVSDHLEAKKIRKKKCGKWTSFYPPHRLSLENSSLFLPFFNPSLFFTTFEILWKFKSVEDIVF